MTHDQGCQTGMDTLAESGDPLFYCGPQFRRTDWGNPPHQLDKFYLLWHRYFFMIKVPTQVEGPCHILSVDPQLLVTPLSMSDNCLLFSVSMMHHCDLLGGTATSHHVPSPLAGCPVSVFLYNCTQWAFEGMHAGSQYLRWTNHAAFLMAFPVKQGLLIATGGCGIRNRKGWEGDVALKREQWHFGWRRATQVPFCAVMTERHSTSTCELQIKHSQSAAAGCKRWNRNGNYTVMLCKGRQIPNAKF